MGINLVKGQKIDLTKADSSGLKRIFVGLGWDAASTVFFGLGGGGSIDLDASCVLYDENNQEVDAVSFTQLRSRDGSIVHTGDNRTGAGDGDDEVINVDLHSVPLNVKTIVFTVNSYRGQTFDKVKNCFARMVNSQTNEELCIFKPSELGNYTGMIMAKLYRHNGNWKVAAIGTPCNGKTVRDLSAEIRTIL